MGTAAKIKVTALIEIFKQNEPFGLFLKK